MSREASPGVAVEVLPVGEGGLLLEVSDLDCVLALEGALRAAVDIRSGPWRQVTDVVPAARTVLLLTATGADLPALARRVAEVAAGVTVGPGGAAARQRDAIVVEIPVRYDGPDLDEVATLTGLSRTEVIAAHTGMPWRVAFGGFAPGFAYLVGGDPRVQVPRRARPRPSVPAGAVGLAGEFSGVYPRSSPGGWQLVGTTPTVLWDVDRDPPALLGPGTTVRFVDVEASS